LPAFTSEKRTQSPGAMADTVVNLFADKYKVSEEEGKRVSSAPRAQISWSRCSRTSLSI